MSLRVEKEDLNQIIREHLMSDSARLSEMTRTQINILNGENPLSRIRELRNARAVLCALAGQDQAVARINVELFTLGAE